MSSDRPSPLQSIAASATSHRPRRNVLVQSMRNVGPLIQLGEAELESLLGRKPAQFDPSLIADRIRGKVVMITGAAGSIGSELCRQIAPFAPSALVGFDQAETPLFHAERKLKRAFPHLSFHAEVGSVTVPGDIHRTLQRYRPSILFHAAGCKHVPMMERQIFAAVQNNVFGTWNTARAASAYGVDCFVMISTDKAVRSASIMGVTKRVAELAVRSLQKESGTSFSAVRFGNVLGSSGSVLPIFVEQIATGGPVTLTHPAMQRYFMTAKEAAQLVLQTVVLGSGGETFVLDMGKPVSIKTLAERLIRHAGLEPDRDIKIEVTGMRPGEKLSEELSLQEDQLVPTSHCMIARLIASDAVSETRMEEFLRELNQAVDSHQASLVLGLLKQVVPDYTPAPPFDGRESLYFAEAMREQTVQSAVQDSVLRPLDGTLAGKLTDCSPIGKI